MFDAVWLRGLGATGLAELMTRRPEVLVPPPPSLVHLALQLSQHVSVFAALRRLDLPTLQVAEAMAALGVRVDRDALVQFLGRDHSAAIEAALGTLVAIGLVEVDRESRLCLAGAASHAWSAPLDVGPPIADLLFNHADDEVAAMLRRHEHDRVPPGELTATMVALLSDPAYVRKIVAAADPAHADRIRYLAAGRPFVDLPESLPAGHWIWWPVERGLLLRANRWSERLAMPAEVCLALRGTDYSAPFDPDPPLAAGAAVDPAAVERDATAHAADFMRLVTAMLDEAGRKPITRLRDGGVGPREQKRLAKTHAAGVEDVRLALEVSHAAGLLSMGMVSGGQPTEHYDDWLNLEPAARLATLVQAWWFAAGATSLDEGPWLPYVDDSAVDVRIAIFRLAAQQQHQAFPDPGGVLKLLSWHRPLLLSGPGTSRDGAEATWRDAQVLGLVGAGTLSPAGQALFHDATDHSALIKAFASIGGVQRQVHLQADLTALVAGTPSPELAELLDFVADRETRGTASTWRFSPSSVRRAFDAGHTAEGLLQELADTAVASVPQTLAYLVRDEQRKHGSVRVCAVASCLSGDDAALLAEITADSKLRSLGLRLLAPTVVASAKPLPETLAALRKAGYSPMAENPDGTAIVELPQVRRAAATSRARRDIDPHRARQTIARQVADAEAVVPAPETLALARALLSRPADARPPAPRRPGRAGPVQAPLGLEFDGLESDGLELGSLELGSLEFDGLESGASN